MTSPLAQPTFPAPYPGLRPFERDEAPLFYGRGTQIATMLKILRTQHFLAVVGSSGCGKSSLVRAGLLPALDDGFLGGPDCSWRFVVTRPGDVPQQRLAEALVRAVVMCETPDPETVRARQATLQTGPGGLLQAIDDCLLPDNTRVLVLVDQFEEVFRFRTAVHAVAEAGRQATSEQWRNEAVAFVNQLLWTVQAKDPRVYVALTMRSDFLGDCDAFLDLPEAINRAQFLTPRLTRDELTDAITRPPKSVHFSGSIDADVTARLLNAMGGSQDMLPLLQHALLRMWHLAKQRDPHGPTRVTRKDFDDAGGFAQALDQHAREVLQSLVDDQGDSGRAKWIAECLFAALCRTSGEGRTVRRLATIGEIAAIADVLPEAVVAVADHFRQPGVNFLVATPAGALAPTSTLDISHESLIRQWSQLREWLAAEQESADVYLRLVQSAKLQAEEKGGWLEDIELHHVLRWRKQRQPTAAWADRYAPDSFAAAMEFLAKSDQAAQHRRKQRRNWIIGGLVLFAGVALVMFLLWQSAQYRLNQVQVFVDTDKVERFKESILADKCNLLFDPEQEACKAARGLSGELVKSLPGHEKTLNKLKNPDTGKGTDKRKAGRQFDMTQRLVQDLEMIQKVTARTTMQDHEQKWQKAIEAIKQDPRYNGMTRKAVGGLVPLGQDPQSQLWEFAHVLSGKVPERDAEDKLQVSADTGMVLVLIPGGSFQMGSKTYSDDGQPVHSVTVPPFFLSKYELTQEQWGRLTGKNPSTFRDDKLGPLPVESVSFDEARTACGWPGLRLPSEAEWEYAARSGGKEEQWAGTSEQLKLGDYAWYSANSKNKTHRIGEKLPNGLGLHDMSGNVWEWVQDCYHNSYKGVPTDGSAWESGDCGRRVVRGGGWDRDDAYSRASKRASGALGSRNSIIGVRCAARLPK